jgi:hypothetical protein
LGIVTTGHGPRDEYIHYHERFLRALGADVKVVIRHIFEDMSLDELLPYEVGRDKPNLGSHLHVPGAIGNAMGDGWEHRFFDLDFATGKVQAAIDRLETDDGADLVVLACAARFPPDSLSAGTLLIHPRELMFSLAADMVEGTRRKVRMGCMVDVEHADLDLADWASRPFYDKIDFVMAPVTSTPLAAAGQLRAAKVELAFYFGYGIGLAPHAPLDQTAALENAIGAPLILPHRTTALYLRNLIGPAIDDHRYLPESWGGE